MAADENGMLAALFWSVTDLLRGRFAADGYGSVVLAFTALRRLDCIRRQEAGTQLAEGWLGVPAQVPDKGVTVQSEQLVADKIRQLLVTDFPAGRTEMLDSLNFARTLRDLVDARLLSRVVSYFVAVDLSPATVSDEQMGRAFEDLLQQCADASPERYGEHRTPQDITELTARLLLRPDFAALPGAAVPSEVYDPCCGTGGMFSAVEAILRNAGATGALIVSGQEVNSQSWALARLAQMMRGADPNAIVQGDVLIDDKHHGRKFEYQLAAPPFGMDWTRQKDAVHREAKDLGSAGRFGAGLPSNADSSLLFVQHLVTHMRPTDRGGGRAAIVISPSPLHRGNAGSGESEIRRWLLEQDLLEGVVALPGRLWPNTSIPSYIWLLSNCKPPHLRGKVIALDGSRSSATLRRSVGAKRQYMTARHVAELVESYEAVRGGMLDVRHLAESQHGALLLDAGDLGYRQVTVEQPLRQSFLVGADTLTTFEETKAVERFSDAKALVGALRSLVGQSWPTLAGFDGALSAALRDAGLASELPRPLQRTIYRDVAVADPEGEVQRGADGKALPDPALRLQERLSLDEDIDLFVRREILPHFPDAWAVHNTVKVGYSIPLAPFPRGRPRAGFGPLSKVARLIPNRTLTSRVRGGKPLLAFRDLRTTDSAAELPDAGDPQRLLASCTGGDVVGLGSNWRLLPPEFGDALTPLTVLRPINNSGHALCEWLRTHPGGQNTTLRISVNSRVPVDLIKDPEFNRLMDTLEANRSTLASTTAGILPNVFRDPQASIDELRHVTRAAASRARLIGELVRPLEDPVWRAEWSYPYHVAALARQYRVAATPSDRYQTLLKLAEGIARCIGVLALAIEIRRKQRFTRPLQDKFTRGDGATWGTWHKSLITPLVKVGPIPELLELEGVLDPGGVIEPLTALLDGRNKNGHAYRAPAAHKVEREISALEPLVVTALESVGWLAARHWDLVDTCNYATNKFTLTGRRLRGSHPDWEPFEYPPRAAPVEPGRIYVHGPSSDDPLDLWPIARAEVCIDCDAPELFLINKINSNRTVMTLRCSKDHEIETAIGG
ncbi:type I restriction-modification system subunit M [Streptomyces sp. NBC_00264]|uniref:class I SAM-dependent DNA methyltransferase n=1 Tax=unclassified Streptomyces TaxID=2593676 RepID=UPI00225BF712|nr:MULTISPECIES: class I SAM-dependent DNA methyltransferase [unclassified Streptomyces]MCX5163707.1 type I restriction-modification system subunit M [Streptomyces sp. NBC_00305]MCX5222230.1 type I restriction-modification system subunit M [Streptomyces sp. NBC_00264]